MGPAENGPSAGSSQAARTRAPPVPAAWTRGSERLLSAAPRGAQCVSTGGGGPGALGTRCHLGVGVYLAHPAPRVRTGRSPRPGRKGLGGERRTRGAPLLRELSSPRKCAQSGVRGWGTPRPRQVEAGGPGPALPSRGLRLAAPGEPVSSVEAIPAESGRRGCKSPAPRPCGPPERGRGRRERGAQLDPRLGRGRGG